MKVHVLGPASERIYSNLPPELLNLAESCTTDNSAYLYKHSKYRHGKIVTEWGSVYINASEPEIVNRPRYFKEILIAHTLLLQAGPTIRNEVSVNSIRETRQLFHNITELNALNIQELFTLINEEELHAAQSQIQVIKNSLREHYDEYANAILRIIKNNAAIRNEFSIFKKLNEVKPKLDTRRHSIRRVISNIVHIFYPDLNAIHVKVIINQCDTRVWLDYDAFQTAVFHLMDNATKYVLPDSEIVIGFRGTDDLIVEFDMISMQILPDELKKIYQEGYSGFYPRKAGVQGNGIGMARIAKVLPFINAKLIVRTDANPEKSASQNGIEYRNNIFQIQFPGRCIAH